MGDWNDSLEDCSIALISEYNEDDLENPYDDKDEMVQLPAVPTTAVCGEPTMNDTDEDSAGNVKVSSVENPSPIVLGLIDLSYRDNMTVEPTTTCQRELC